MGKRDNKPTTGKAKPAAARPKASASHKARSSSVPASRPASRAKPAAKVPATAKGGTAKAAQVKPVAKAAKAVPAAPQKARAQTKAAQKQSDKKLVDRAKVSAIVLSADYRPSEDEPFMNEHQRMYFRQKLLNWKEEIIRQTKETLEGLHEDSVQHADLADRATSETDRALELRARDRQRKLVSKIDAALARIEDGTYGYCEETGEPIGLKRLDARPIATLSLEAQERHERRERVYRED
ncbi:MAG: RNA polymerase-binding protein DksA [Hyphomicrobium sp.]|jgi:DnaK suppressor protein|nr:RNA polymerase-binding protein DksA [Hyphomicrobium sp.]